MCEAGQQECSQPLFCSSHSRIFRKLPLVSAWSCAEKRASVCGALRTWIPTFPTRTLNGYREMIINPLLECFQIKCYCSLKVDAPRLVCGLRNNLAHSDHLSAGQCCEPSHLQDPDCTCLAISWISCCGGLSLEISLRQKQCRIHCKAMCVFMGFLSYRKANLNQHKILVSILRMY